MNSNFNECRILAIPRFTDQRGSLSAIEGQSLLPFELKRFYYLYELPTSARRGCHAHKTEHELIMALAGRFKVEVSDGESSKEFELRSPDQCLYIPPLVWHELYGFAPGSICGVLASERYNPEDYYYVYEEFLDALRQRQF
jgi:mannose-6-phosphate isomerase-like protein (cupin superfamily)